MMSATTAARRRALSYWYQTAGCTPPEGGKTSKLSAVADRTRSHTTDRDRDAHPSINLKPNTPAPMSAVATPSQSNGHPSP